MTDFAITENDARIQYTATASQTVFPYDFPIFDQTHLTVTRVRSGTTTTLVLTTDYTVSGVGVQAGGNVTLTSGATASDLITIARDVPAARATDYNAAGDFFATSLNQDLDLLVMVDQQIIRDADRALRLSISDTLASFNALPSASARANGFLTFDGSGQPSIASGASDIPVSSAMVPVVQAISVSAGRDAFGVEIGSDVQAYDAGLASIAGLTTTADQMLYLVAADSYAATTITQFGRTLVDDANAAAALSTLGIANHNNIVVTAAGEATNSLQPAFLAYNSSDDASQTGNGAVATVGFDTEVYDQGGDFASNTFTAPVTGRYLLTATVTGQNFGASASSAVLIIATSNRSYRVIKWNPPTSNVSDALTISTVADMDAADTATVTYQVNGMAGNTVAIAGGASPLQTFFSGVLLA